MQAMLRLLLAICLISIYTVSTSSADVELEIKSNLPLKESPLDMTFSRDGQWLYLLNKNGTMEIYTHQGALKGTVEVGQGYDRIEAGPMEDEVYLLNSKDKSIRILEVIPDRQIDTSASPFKGAEDAPVVIADFTDFQCPYCAKLGATFDRLLAMYPGKIKIVYKSYPLKNHRYAWKAAVAAMAAHQKGKFWEFHDRLFENYKVLSDEKIMEIRKEFGFDTPEFAALIRSYEVRTRVAQDRNEGQQIGVRGTPSIFINGKPLKDKTLQGFQIAIEKELTARGS